MAAAPATVERSGLERLTIPEGISQIIWYMSQEILRDQPKDIIAYAAKFTHDLHNTHGRLAIGNRRSEYITSEKITKTKITLAYKFV